MTADMSDAGAPGESQARTLAAQALEATRADRSEEAIDLWEEALDLAPADTDIAIEATNYLCHVGQARRAAELCDRLLLINPGLHLLWTQKGVISYNHLSDIDGAIQNFQKALDLAPDDKFTHRALALIYYHRVDIDNTRRHAARAVTGVDRKTDLGYVVQYASDYAEGLALARSLLEESPDDHEVLNQLSKCLRVLGRLDEAAEAAARASALAPDNMYYLHQLGELDMLRGEWRDGWRRIEAALVGQNVKEHAEFAEVLPWRFSGQDLRGKRLLVVQYSGIGDGLMFARFGKDLQARGAHVTLSCRGELLRLMRGLAGFDDVVAGLPLARWADYDHWVLDWVLPGHVMEAAHTTPHPTPYVAPPADSRAVWGPRIQQVSSGLKAGLCWSSRPHYFSGVDRTLHVETLAPLARIPGIEWFVVQKMHDNVRIRSVFHSNIHDYSQEWDDFADTAAVMEQLDLIISIDSGPLHLAGALGKPVWGLIPASAEWRWGPTGERSIWYPTLRLFRQPRPRAWDHVVERLAAELAAVVASRADKSDAAMFDV
jgi:Flp pilus assembly protein TadD